jgi:capsular polysaccharide biosynthesis protein
MNAQKWSSNEVKPAKTPTRAINLVIGLAGVIMIGITLCMLLIVIGYALE